jgi:hypothetical protein
MKSAIRHEALELLKQAQAPRPTIITEADLLRLPDPIQRYLRYTQIIGKAAIATVHLKQKGFFKTQPNKQWMPVVADQYFTVNPPALLWNAKISAAPFLSIAVKDSFVEGHGHSLAKLLSVITLADARGREIDQGALLRYLGEMGWFPTAWLSDQIEWQAIDAFSAQATMHDRDLTASAILHVNEQGQLTEVTAERYRDAKPVAVLTPWSGRFSDYREVNGILIPMQAVGSWQLDSGEFSYFRGEITEIEYDPSLA